MQGSTGIENFKENCEPEIIDYDLDNLSKCRKLLDLINQKLEYLEYLFDKRKFNNDVKNGVWCAKDGKEANKLPSTATENI